MSIAFAGLNPPMRITFDEPLSVDDFWRISAENPDLRMERVSTGELIVMSPTGTEGGGVEGDVFGELRNWALADKRGKAYGPNAGFSLPDGSVRAADASWISWSRLNTVTSEQLKKFAPICPEFVIEVRSETDSLITLQHKLRSWLANGAELVWLVDPSRKAVEIFRPGREPELLEGGSIVEGDGPVAGFILELGRIWT